MTSEMQANETFDFLRSKEGLSFLRSIFPQIVFRNALQGFVREHNSASDQRIHHTIYAVDAMEVYAWVNPEKHHLRSFSFGSLLSGADGPHYTDIQNHSDITAEQLLFEDKKQFIIFDSHISECKALFNAILSRSIEVEEINRKISGNNPEKEIQDIYEKIKEKINSDDVRLEQSSINNVSDIISIWSENFKDIYLNHAKLAGRVSAFSRKANYTSIFSARARFFESGFMKGFGSRVSHTAFERFLGFPQTQQNLILTKETLRDLLTKISSDDTRPQHELNAAIDRDVESLSLAQCINDFLSSCRIPVRIEFVTRSHRLHLAAFMLGYGRLRVSVRHPMFIPGVHKLHPSALNSLKDISQEVDHCIAALSKFEFGGEQIEGGKRRRHSRQLHTTLKQLAAEAVSQMTDVVISRKISNRLDKKTDETAVQSIIQSVSDYVLDDFREEDGDYEHAITEVVSKNIMSSTGFFRSRTGSALSGIHDNFFKGKNLRIFLNKVQLNPFRDDMPDSSPDDMISFRVLGSRMPRLFFLHGDGFRRWIENETQLSSQTPPAGSPFVAEIDASVLFNYTARTPSNVSLEVPTLDTLEAVLLQSILYASMGWYAVASTVISQLTRPVTAQLRRAVPTQFGEQASVFSSDIDPKIALAYKELFLLRHYCERAISRENKPDDLSPFVNEHAGDSARNIARAQRDLDLAVYMSEEYFRLINNIADGSVSDPNMKNIASFRQNQRFAFDARLSLVHTASWLELFVSNSINERADEEAMDAVLGEALSDVTSKNSLTYSPMASKEIEFEYHKKLFGTRYETWMSAGIIKQLEIENKRISMERLALAHQGRFPREERLWAYLETHGMSVLSMSFLCAAVLDRFPGVGAIWNPWTRVSYEQFLVFRDWKHWFLSVLNLDEAYRFEIRTVNLINCFLNFFENVDKIRNNILKNRLKNSDDIVRFHKIYLRELKKFEDSVFESYQNISMDQLEMPDGLMMKMRPIIYKKIKSLRELTDRKLNT